MSGIEIDDHFSKRAAREATSFHLKPEWYESYDFCSFFAESGRMLNEPMMSLPSLAERQKDKPRVTCPFHTHHLTRGGTTEDPGSGTICHIPPDVAKELLLQPSSHICFSFTKHKVIIQPYLDGGHRNILGQETRRSGCQ